MNAMGCVLVLAAISVPGIARGESFSLTNLQLLYGGPFDDSGYGNNTHNRRMFTLTLEHIGT